MNITLNDTNPVLLTGLTEGKDYLIQGFYKKTSDGDLIDRHFNLTTESAEDEIWPRANVFRVTAAEGLNIYVRAVTVPTKLAITRCN